MMRALFMLTTSIVSIPSVAFISTACVSYNSFSFVGVSRPQAFVSCKHAFIKHACCICSVPFSIDQDLHLFPLEFNNISSFWCEMSSHDMGGTPHINCMQVFCNGGGNPLPFCDIPAECILHCNVDLMYNGVVSIRECFDSNSPFGGRSISPFLFDFKVRSSSCAIFDGRFMLCFNYHAPYSIAFHGGAGAYVPAMR